MNEEEWTVPEFYTALFDYCFPVDYRMQLRKTLARCHQNDKSVAEYTHELQDLFNMIRNIPEQDQVLKFWNSARPSIQKELWRNKLNPELSLWRKVVAQAEIIEIAEDVAERQDRKVGPPTQASGLGGNNSKHKFQPADRSIQAVTFKAHGKNLDKCQGRTGHTSYEGQQSGTSSFPRDRTPAEKGKSKGGFALPHRPYNFNRTPHCKTPLLSDKEKAEY